MKLSMFSGGILMYIAYDLTHYYLHFGAAFSEASRQMKVFELTAWTAFPPWFSLLPTALIVNGMW